MGAAFGPLTLLALYWRRFNFWGALASTVAGTLVATIWAFASGGPGGMLDIQPATPGFAIGLLVGILVTLRTPVPAGAGVELFDPPVPAGAGVELFDRATRQRSGSRVANGGLIAPILSNKTLLARASRARPDRAPMFTEIPMAAARLERQRPPGVAKLPPPDSGVGHDRGYQVPEPLGVVPDRKVGQLVDYDVVNQVWFEHHHPPAKAQRTVGGTAPPDRPLGADDNAPIFALPQLGPPPLDPGADLPTGLLQVPFGNRAPGLPVALGILEVVGDNHSDFQFVRTWRRIREASGLNR